MGSFPKNPQNWAGNRDFQNKTMNNFSTVHAIFAQISSIGAAWQRNSKFQWNHQHFVLGVTFWEKIPPNGDFKPKHTVE
jgi:hypothetical protein